MKLQLPPFFLLEFCDFRVSVEEREEEEGVSEEDDSAVQIVLNDRNSKTTPFSEYLPG